MPIPEGTRQFVGLREIAERLGLTHATVKHWWKEGRLIGRVTEGATRPRVVVPIEVLNFYLRYFRLVPIDGGFILQYPRKERPTDLPEINAATKLSAVFRQADAWLQKTGIEDMGRLNRLVRQDHAHELILVAEAFHEQQIAYIARDIYERHEDSGARLVLIAGPSSSGKTTFAKRLAIQLLAHGLRPFTLELDNYFVDRDLTPRDEKGDFDFEALEAINLTLFNSQILELMSGWEVRLPRFDFIKGRSGEGRMAKLAANQIIIVEGIHTNVPLHRKILQDAGFRKGGTDIHYLERMLHDWTGTSVSDDDVPR